MGYGNYSAQAHQAIVSERTREAPEDIFIRNDCDPAMNPLGVRYRESRDSADSPESVGIVFVLDVSSSMGDIPHALASRTLPSFMTCVLTVLPDPQVLFMAVGNASTDHSSLQVGQFESTAELMDRWLSAIHIEGGGGGWGESYELAMYFAAHHTSMDCLEKRGKKGYLFMTGDEVPFYEVMPSHVKGLIGDTLEERIIVHDMVATLGESFTMFFLIPDAERAAIESCGAVWTLLCRERCIILQDIDDTAIVCALLIGIEERVLADIAAIEHRLVAMGGYDATARARICETVRPFCEALQRGPIEPPGKLYRRSDDPGEGGKR